MQNNSFDSPIWGPGTFKSSRRTFITFEIQPPPEFRVDQTKFILAEAEAHLSRGRPEEAVKLCQPLAERNDLARRLLLGAFVAIGNARGIIQFFSPPRAPAEIVYLANALWEERQFDQLQELLLSQLVRESADPAVQEVRRKYSERLRQ